jgi:citrate lyase alpha subunit
MNRCGCTPGAPRGKCGCGSLGYSDLKVDVELDVVVVVVVVEILCL